MSIGNSIRVRGIGGTLHLLLLRCFNFNRTPAHILSRMLDLKKFDREHNVETAGLIELDELGFDSPVKKLGTRYGGITPWRLKDLLDQIPEDFSTYTFIDIGSGKGAALFHAAEYPFRRIIGVEFSPELHEVALRNIKSFRSKTRKCMQIEAVCGDGGAYELPEGPLILFYNSPFDVPVWERAAKQIENMKPGNGRSYLIYSNWGWLPNAAAFVDQLSFLKLIHVDSDQTSRIYEIKRP
jgi:SAM-dependent methyltransferase